MSVLIASLGAFFIWIVRRFDLVEKKFDRVEQRFDR
jgi:hypothetical protein